MTDQNLSLLATRHNDRGNTTDNLQNLLDVLADPKTARVVLFATAEAPEGLYDHRTDGPETNLPLVAALAEIRVPGITPLHVVFDGLFLTAQRKPRYDEVRALLDTAVVSNKAFFAAERAPFTSTYPPGDAAQVLLDAAGTAVQLTAATRARYFAMLGTVSESSYAAN